MRNPTLFTAATSLAFIACVAAVITIGVLLTTGGKGMAGGGTPIEIVSGP